MTANSSGSRILLFVQKMKYTVELCDEAN